VSDAQTRLGVPGSDPDPSPEVGLESPWLSLGDAGRLTGKHPDTIRALARRGRIPARKSNRSAWVVQVPARMLPGSVPEYPGSDPERLGDSPESHPATPGSDPVAELLGELREEVADLREALGRSEAGRDAAVAQAQAEGNLQAARAEAERDATRTTLADMRQALDQERARADRLEAALLEARRPWLAKVLEGLRRKGS
jgi:hypothetical protein